MARAAPAPAPAMALAAPAATCAFPMDKSVLPLSNAPAWVRYTNQDPAESGVAHLPTKLGKLHPRAKGCYTRSCNLPFVHYWHA